MKLEGSCSCGAVRFTVESRTPVPFNLCYCSICRKTGGGGGYAINIMGDANSLAVVGKEHVATYRAVKDGRESEGRRHFCSKCGSSLYLADPRWPDWVYPMASAIDTPLPAAPERVHLMLGSRANWVPVPPEGPQDRHFEEYPEEGIAEWHEKRELDFD